MRKHAATMSILLIFCIGLSLLLYPTLSDRWNQLHQSHAVASYADTVSKMNKEKYEKIREIAIAYNEKLVGKGMNDISTIQDQQGYREALSLNEAGMMGYLEIPDIDCLLPIYHGTDAEILQIAIGHIPGSSLPIGGPGSHCVLSGHRGLPSAKLFTDLDKLSEGGLFYIHVLDEVLAYEVDQILIVLPEETDMIQIEEEKDYCTLVTCTPYGVNSHRLLVRGCRVANDRLQEMQVRLDAQQIPSNYIAGILAVIMMGFLLCHLYFPFGRKIKIRRRGDI